MSNSLTAPKVYSAQRTYDWSLEQDKLSPEQSVKFAEARDIVREGQEQYGGVVFRIPEVRISDLRKKLEKITRRAAKLNVAPPVLTDTGEREDERLSKTKVHTWAYVTITGDAPHLGGWTFLATLQHEQEGTIIRRVPNPKLEGEARAKFEEKLDGLAKFRNAKPVCDHCNFKRVRKDTYVVVHEDGRTLQVGSNCLADFLGGLSPQAAAKGMEYIWTIMDEARRYGSDGFNGISVDPTVDTEWYLTHVAWAIRNNGWVSRGKAYDYGRTASADLAASNMENQERHLTDRQGVRLWEDPSDEDAEMAMKTIAWVRNEFEGDTDYAHNLTVTLASDNLKYRQFGIAASAVFVYKRETEEKEKVQVEKASSLNEHFGQEKDRVNLRLAVKTIKPIYQGGYNGEDCTYLHTMKDDKGRTFKWFGSYSLDEGETYTGKWTVKGHGEWKGLKETRINRPHGLTKVEA